MLSSGVSEDSYSVHTYNKLKKKKKKEEVQDNPWQFTEFEPNI
jgi:hypothetical protein